MRHRYVICSINHLLTQLFVPYFILFKGFGNHGELARSADMTTPSKDGKYNLRSNQYYRYTSDSIESIVRNQFLKPSPVRWSWGSHHNKQVVSIACGQYHLLACAREAGDTQLRLYSSGLNNYGQLGLGDNEDRHELTLVRACLLSVAFIFFR
jgi:hypothetical protein